jgi:hypothetical protein
VSDLQHEPEIPRFQGSEIEQIAQLLELMSIHQSHSMQDNASSMEIPGSLAFGYPVDCLASAVKC